MADQSPQGVPKNLLDSALQLHRQGRLKEAEALYRQIVQHVPNHFDALYWLGLIHLGRGDAERGIVLLSQALRTHPDSADALIYLGHALNTRHRYEEALASFDKALEINPRLPVALNNRGLALHGLGRYQEAVASFDQALALDPANADALNNRGATLQKLERHEEALAGFRRAVALRPRYPEALGNCGKVLLALGRHEEALLDYEKALALKPRNADALNGKGLALQELGRHAEAVDAYRQGLALSPDDPETFNNLGVALLKTKRYDEALACCERALALKPGFREALSNRGAVLLVLGRYAEALANLDRALASEPDFVDALVNRGNTLQALRRHAEAIADYRRAEALRPGYPDALYNESLAHLCLGELETGWEQYETRWTRKEAPERRPLSGKPWLGGEDITGKRLLLWAEQGMGDSIQFCRYAPMLARRGIEVLLEVPFPLKALMGTLEGVTTVTTETESVPAHDYHCPLLSLPLALRTEVPRIPDAVPYLAAAPGRVEAWQRTLERNRAPRVGIVCSGNPNHRNDRNRSIPLHEFSPLLETGVSLHLLQKECTMEDEAFLAETPQIRDLRPRLTDFTETAAAIACLDLVISVDTSVAHLAGALAKPVWILLPFSPDWRWMLDRDDSPWYPSARLFRQTAMGVWQDVIEHVRAELAQRAGDLAGR